MAFNPQEHMMNLKGKQYLQVMWRLVWFREDHPNWCINTQMICWDKENQTAVFQCEIVDDCEHKVSTGYGSESARDFHDYIEKAETKSVGRALAMLGYGTQFAPELDEEERIVDSPVPKKEKKKQDPVNWDAFANSLMAANVNIEALCAQFKVGRIEELTPAQVNKITSMLPK